MKQADIERGEVRTAGRNNRVIKDALLIGSLAVHPSIMRSAAGWTITHRATGCALGFADNEGDATIAAQELVHLYADSFDELDRLPFGATAHSRLKEPAIARLNHGLEAMGLRR